ncbi:unnamed protein product [Clonostachys chloroleuca]|uniref:Uncharacterized protein n=1 Tax=Clonostachys chloroleuca TaxID=1926264 RepID=A0AA35MCB6_9HYPO|nr:unnamed protein product [Clonostachys chloroleuca]
MLREFANLTNCTDEIWDLASYFREKISEVELALSKFVWKYRSNMREILYTLKYPELKAIGDEETTWVIRQCGLYHQNDLRSKQNTWLLFFPNTQSSSAQLMIDHVGEDEHPLQAHMSFYFSHFNNWRWQMNKDLRTSGEVSQASAQEFDGALQNLDAQVESMTRNATHLLSRVSTTIQALTNSSFKGL